MFFSLCVEAKSELLEAIRNHQEFLTDPERNQGRLTKEDKVKLFMEQINNSSVFSKC